MFAFFDYGIVLLTLSALTIFSFGVNIIITSTIKLFSRVSFLSFYGIWRGVKKLV